MAPPSLPTLALSTQSPPSTYSPPSTQSAGTSRRNRTPSLIATLNAKQDVVVKAKEDQAARHMTKVKSRTLKSAGRLIDNGVSTKTQSYGRGNLLMCIAVVLD